MIIGACRIKLHIFESYSLKDKRQVIKSLIERLKSRYNISIAEIDNLDSWQSALIGFACVSNETKHVQSVINNVIGFIDHDGRLEITAQDIEIL
jgi:uncharacterized protein YlxP (DUF503 family)